MIRRPSFLVVVTLLFSVLSVPTTTAFSLMGPSSRAFVPVTRQSTTSTSVFMGMAQPEVEIKTKTKVETKQKQKIQQTQKSKTGEPVSRREEDFQDAPLYKLMLLEDNSYDAEHVITRMCAICEDLDEDAASTIYQQAQQEGKAMCGKYPFEVAELYKEQLLRSDPMIFADMEEENA